jgi:predicted RNase H-like HicB family nuclease/DNA-binding XRE family transcriptional regulator
MEGLCLTNFIWYNGSEMQYHFRVHPGKPAWAECIELKGCVTQGRSRAELERNMVEALHLYLEEPRSSKVIFPSPRRIPRSQHIVSVEVNPSVAFAVQLRQSRLRSRLTQREAARRLGLRSIYSYQRLERRANPSLATIKKITTLFPELSLDSVLGGA